MWHAGGLLGLEVGKGGSLEAVILPGVDKVPLRPLESSSQQCCFLFHLAFNTYFFRVTYLCRCICPVFSSCTVNSLKVRTLILIIFASYLCALHKKYFTMDFFLFLKGLYSRNVHYGAWSLNNFQKLNLRLMKINDCNLSQPGSCNVGLGFHLAWICG